MWITISFSVNEGIGYTVGSNNDFAIFLAEKGAVDCIMFVRSFQSLAIT